MKTARVLNCCLVFLAVLAVLLQTRVSRAQLVGDPYFAPLYNQMYVASGPLTGTFYAGINGAGSRWYFSNIALLPMVTLQNKVVIHNYLNQYLKHVDPTTGTIQDYADIYYHIQHPITMPSDADDSSTSTFLTLAAKYYNVTHDTAWWNVQVGKMKDIANKTLLKVQASSGLIPNLIAPRRDNEGKITAYQTYYLFDNCEDYRGLADFTSVLKVTGDPDAQKYQNAATRVAKGIVKLYDQSGHYFHELDTTVPPYFEDDPGFYPLRVAQVSPQLYQVPLVGSVSSPGTKAMYTDGWNFLNASGEPWEQGPGAMTDQSLMGFPDMFLGYVAAVRGDRVRAQTQLDYFYSTATDISTYKTLHSNYIHEIGYAYQIKLLLSQP